MKPKVKPMEAKEVRVFFCILQEPIDFDCGFDKVSVLIGKSVMYAGQSLDACGWVPLTRVTLPAERADFPARPQSSGLFLCPCGPAALRAIPSGQSGRRGTNVTNAIQATERLRTWRGGGQMLVWLSVAEVTTRG